MEILTDECGQGAAEYILLFGGVIVIAVAALAIYKQYYTNAGGLTTGSDLDKVRTSVT